MKLKNIEWIEKYFNNHLSEKEKQSVEDKLRHDKEFAEDIVFYQQTKRLAKKEADELKKAEWAALATKLENRPNYQWVLWAGALILLFWAVFFAFRSYQKPSPLRSWQEMANESIEQIVLQDPTTMGIKSEDSLMVQGIRLLNEGNTEKARILLESAASQNTKNHEAQEALGLCLLKIKDFDAAQKIFEQLAAIELVGNKALYYQALILIQKNEKQAAIALFEKIVADKTEYIGAKKQARKWLELSH